MTPESSKRLEEIMDPTKVVVYCALHNYFGPSKDGAEVKPAQNCQRCWFVLYFHDIVSAPPEDRAQRMDELEAVVHKMCELADKGKWDYEPYRHAKIEIEKEFD